MRSILVSLLLVACASPSNPAGIDPVDGGGPSGKPDGGTTAVPDVHCAGVPDAGPAGEFRHLASDAVAAISDPRHRGFDLVAGASADPQRIAGAISYGAADKALEDEDVDLFACRAGTWTAIGSARTDGEGRFALELAGSARLPIGMRDLYVSVTGDRTGTGFLGYVAGDDQPLIVSDVDGTLTSSENAFFETVALGIEPGAQPGAAAAYRMAAARGYQLVYVTARGNQYTDETRRWLAGQGFPRGPVRLAPSFITLPGGDTIDYKTSTIGALALPVVWGIGNRASDITAYTNVGIDPKSIFILAAEFASEVQPEVDAGHAIGLASYDDLRDDRVAMLPVR